MSEADKRDLLAVATLGRGRNKQTKLANPWSPSWGPGVTLKVKKKKKSKPTSNQPNKQKTG